jgi:hypothetical protein
MRIPTLALIGALSLSLAVPAVAATGERKFKGSSEDGNVQFRISNDGKRVKKFRFVNACPADKATGTLVPGSFRIKQGKNGILKFSHKDSQFTIKGRFVSSSKAKGTAQNDTGNCHSGKLHWTATAK